MTLSSVYTVCVNIYSRNITVGNEYFLLKDFYYVLDNIVERDWQHGDVTTDNPC